MSIFPKQSFRKFTKNRMNCLVPWDDLEISKNICSPDLQFYLFGNYYIDAGETEFLPQELLCQSLLTPLIDQCHLQSSEIFVASKNQDYSSSRQDQTHQWYSIAIVNYGRMTAKNILTCFRLLPKELVRDDFRYQLLHFEVPISKQNFGADPTIDMHNDVVQCQSTSHIDTSYVYWQWLLQFF
ncbi:hypothetical protein ROZALSC1DRAFT_23673 [Rozella allomycis CSF55]|uniref:Uncharacterized protein n=1 Tax=Rozella allomycis (strain CSF55) TaxID=988480 RepID=A0A4P9YH33_ROZAC|nr:hypothetical protein ROZALSC1DRAFT_23673 [Rozella allomycis CSF55]